MGPREEIPQAVRRFAAAEAAPFVPGQTYIPASGKQIGPDEIAACVDAALDGWLTAGRFSEQLERDLAHRVGTRWARLVNSGSSANLLAVQALTQPELGDRRRRPSDEVLTVAAIAGRSRVPSGSRPRRGVTTEPRAGARKPAPRAALPAGRRSHQALEAHRRRAARAQWLSCPRIPEA